MVQESTAPVRGLVYSELEKQREKPHSQRVARES